MHAALVPELQKLGKACSVLVLWLPSFDVALWTVPVMMADLKDVAALPGC